MISLGSSCVETASAPGCCVSGSGELAGCANAGVAASPATSTQSAAAIQLRERIAPPRRSVVANHAPLPETGQGSTGSQ